MRDKLIFGVKVLVSLGLLVYLFRRVGGGQRLFVLLSNANAAYVLLALALYVTAVVVGNGKWATLLRAQGIRVPFRALLAYTFVGAFFNNFLPANVGGDVMRGYGLAQHTQRTADAAVSVVMDRLIGLVAFLTMAALAGTSVLLAARWDLGMAVDAAALANVRTLTILAWVGEGALVVLTAMILSRRTKRWLEAFLARLPLLRAFVPAFHKLATAINAYRHAYRAIVLGLFISWTVLILTTVENWLLAQALLPGSVPFLYVLLFNPLIAFALLVPLSVGGLGIGQSAYVFFYSLVGVPSSLALAISLLHQAIVYAGSLPGAALWLQRQHRARQAADPVGLYAESVRKP